MVLTAAELLHLTNKSRGDAQARVLNFMGIQYKRRPDGSLAVSQAHVELLLGCTDRKNNNQEIEPNWSAL